MACACNTPSITKEEKRWIVIGICLTKVLTPALRKVLASEMKKWHQDLCKHPTEIDKQFFGRKVTKLPPSNIVLNYKNINNNHVHRSPCLFDYTVKDSLSLAKLFVQPNMCKFTGFDQTMDASAVLSVVCEAAPFTGASADAKTIRSDVRNEWAHCNFADWTGAKFTDAFKSMKSLLKNVNLSREEEQELCDELEWWQNIGIYILVVKSLLSINSFRN